MLNFISLLPDHSNELKGVRISFFSFPTVSLHGRRSLIDKNRRFFLDLVSGEDWAVTEIDFDNELVFCVDKGE